MVEHRHSFKGLVLFVLFCSHFESETWCYVRTRQSEVMFDGCNILNQLIEIFVVT